MIKQRLSDIYKKKILAIVRDEPGISRAELNKRTGVRMPTIIGVIDHLVKKGMIVEQKGAVRPTKGRRSFCLSLNPRFRQSIGIDIMGEEVHLALVGFDGTVLASERAENGEGLRERLTAAVNGLIAGADIARLEGIVVSFPGFVDRRDHSIISSSVVKHLASFDFLAGIARSHDVRFEAENPPRAIAVHEARLRPDTFVLVEVDEGVSCCTVNNGRLYTTATKLEGEAGHLTMPGSDIACGCGGTGCVEAVIRPAALVEGLKKAVEKNSDTLLYYLAKKDINAIDFDLAVRASEEGDEFVNAFLKERFKALRVLLRSVILMCDPRLVLFTGRLTMCKTVL